jgi:uncharacterized protein YodC (DUF2158 family)
MPESSVKVGDVVELKSGGPLMTVQSISIDPGRKRPIMCSWFTRANDAEPADEDWRGPFTHAFNVESIKVVDLRPRAEVVEGG